MVVSINIVIPRAGGVSTLQIFPPPGHLSGTSRESGYSMKWRDVPMGEYPDTCAKRVWSMMVDRDQWCPSSAA